MNWVILNRNSDGFLQRKYGNESDDNFKEFIDYIWEGDIWSNLIDPSINRNNASYVCGNFYCTKNDGFKVLLTDLHLLDNTTYEDLKPIEILENTLYGMVVAFRQMKNLKVPEFIIKQEGQRYTFTAFDIKPIVVDSDLGNLYNETIPHMIVRRVNKEFTWDICNYDSIDNAMNGASLKSSLELIGNFIIRHYDPILFYTILQWKNDADTIRQNQKITYNQISVSNWGDTVKLAPALKKDRTIHFGKINIISSVELYLTKPSLLKFLQAWESRLQHCDAFTLVFLGQTLRFFEGEPLSSDQKF